jgi:hypothetical protein
MSLFAKHFSSILEADEVDVNAADTAGAEQQAMKQQLEPNTNPKALDAQVPPDLEAAKGAHTAVQKKALTEWISRIADFVNFLNGVEGTSVQSQLAAAGCDSLFEKVASSEKKRIARVAMELSSLNESLKGYLISNDNG